MKTITALLGAALLASAPAAAQPGVDPQAKLDRALAGRVAGAPVSCLPLVQATRSEVVPGRAIIYRIGSRLYLNRPVSGLEWLNADSILVSFQPIGQQCRNDTVQLVDRVSGFQRGFVVLGDFVPYTRAKARS